MPNLFLALLAIDESGTDFHTSQFGTVIEHLNLYLLAA